MEQGAGTKLNIEHRTSNAQRRTPNVERGRGAGSSEQGAGKVRVLEYWSGKEADKMRSMIGRKGGDKHRTPNIQRPTGQNLVSRIGIVEWVLRALGDREGIR